MISSPFYSPERINYSKSSVSPPLQIFKQVASSVTTPIVLDGVFFSKSDFGRLTCYLEITGEVKWTSQTEKILTSSPLKCADKLYVIDYENEDVLTLDVRNGRQLENLGECDTTDWLVKKKNIYLNVTDRGHEYRKQLYCREGDTYKTNWVYRGFQFDSYAASEDYIVLKDRDGGLAGLDTSGREIWRLSPLDVGLFSSQSVIDAIPDSKPGLSNLNRTIGYPMIYQNRIGIVPMLDNHLIGVDITTGKVLWTRKAENSHNWIRQGYCSEVYCLSSDYIEAFSLETGKQTKKVAIDASYISKSLGVETISFTQFTVSETHIFAASSIMQYFSAIDIKTGNVDWTFNPEESITATDQPYVANGRVYYPCLGKMYIFEGRDGYIPPTT